MKELTDAQKSKQEQVKAERESIKASYQESRNLSCMVDLQKTIQNLIEAHTRIAKDGTGVRDNQQVRLDRDERFSQLDMATGIEEIKIYIERMMADSPTPKSE